MGSGNPTIPVADLGVKRKAPISPNAQQFSIIGLMACILEYVSILSLCCGKIDETRSISMATCISNVNGCCGFSPLSVWKG